MFTINGSHWAVAHGCALDRHLVARGGTANGKMD